MPKLTIQNVVGTSAIAPWFSYARSLCQKNMFIIKKYIFFCRSFVLVLLKNCFALKGMANYVIKKLKMAIEIWRLCHFCFVSDEY